MAKTLFDQTAAENAELATKLGDAAASTARRVVQGDLAARDQHIAALEARIARLERQLAAMLAAGAVQ
jgi:hypothetical protein